MRRGQRRRLQIARMPVVFDRAAVIEAGVPVVQPACSSSSLGKDSDEGSSPGKEAEDGEGEVQSAHSGAGLAGLGALEESLPIRRGISKFYNGKSRSFTFLREAITPSGSSRAIAKADNAYTRKRRNFLAYSIMYDKSLVAVPQSYESGTTKRLASLSKLRPLDGMSSRSSSSSLSSDENDLPQQFICVQSSDNTNNFAPPKIAAPRFGPCTAKTLPVPMRSFSVMDVHCLQRSCSVRLKEEEY